MMFKLKIKYLYTYFKLSWAFICGFLCSFYINQWIINYAYLSSDVSILNHVMPVITTNSMKIQNEFIETFNKRNNTDKRKRNRPRYYSSELEIKRNIAIGILLTSKSYFDKITKFLDIFNTTINQLLFNDLLYNQVIFFLPTTLNIQSRRKFRHHMFHIIDLSNKDERSRPFHMLKYIYDTFINEFDYFYFSRDRSFINFVNLNLLSRQISLSQKFVYFGKKSRLDSSFCSLDAGILINNRLLREINKNFNWCIQNSITNDEYGENIGRCISYSANVECVESFKSRIFAYKMKYLSVKNHIEYLERHNQFLNAIAIYPIFDLDDFYLLNILVLKQQIMMQNQIIEKLGEKLQDRIYNDKRVIWSPNEFLKNYQISRFDVISYKYFNSTHIFPWNEYDVIRRIPNNELDSLNNIIRKIKLIYNLKNLTLDNIENGYLKFDFSQGVDYIFDMRFQSTKNDESNLKRFSVYKPLSNTELLSSDLYIKENSIISIIMPVYQNEIKLLINFLKQCLFQIQKSQKKNNLIIVFLYTEKYENEQKYFTLLEKLLGDYQSISNDSIWNIHWYSMNTTKFSTFHKYKLFLEITITDLILRKIGSNSLMLLLNPRVEFDTNNQFLNRVKMNVIPNLQVFNPIPYKLYFEKEKNYIFDENDVEIGIDIHQRKESYFNQQNNRYLAFHARDYILIRKKTDSIIPIIYNENDIQKSIQNFRINKAIVNCSCMMDYFLKFQPSLHILRAPEPNLKTAEEVIEN